MRQQTPYAFGTTNALNVIKGDAMNSLNIKYFIALMSILLGANTFADEIGTGGRNETSSNLSSGIEDRRISKPDCGFPSLNIPPNPIEASIFFLNEQKLNSTVSPELCKKEYDVHERNPYIRPIVAHVTNINRVVDTIDACEFKPYEKKALSEKLLKIVEHRGRVKGGTGYHMTGAAMTCLGKINQNSQNCDLAIKLLEASQDVSSSSDLYESGRIGAGLEAVERINCTSDDLTNRIIEKSAEDAHYVNASFYNSYLTKILTRQRIQNGRESTFKVSIQKFCQSETLATGYRYASELNQALNLCRK